MGERTVELSDGFNMPQMGLGSFRQDSLEETKETVKNAVKNGVRFFEISELFCNGHFILQALTDQGISRESIFISLKLWPKNRSPEVLYESCKKLIEVNNFGYIDLIIIHAPIDVQNRFDQWKALEQLKQQNLVNSLGACNITINHLMTILKDSDYPPVTFELEVAPFNQMTEIVEFCIAGSIAIISQDPLSKGVFQRNQLLLDIAIELGISTEELLFRWSVSKGYVTLIPPNSHHLNEIDSTNLLEPLPDYVVSALDQLENGEKTSFAPAVEDDD